jgi:hypothetical protein
MHIFTDENAFGQGAHAKSMNLAKVRSLSPHLKPLELLPLIVRTML